MKPSQYSDFVQHGKYYLDQGELVLLGAKQRLHKTQYFALFSDNKFTVCCGIKPTDIVIYAKYDYNEMLAYLRSRPFHEYILISAIWYEDLEIDLGNVPHSHIFPINIESGFVFTGYRHIHCLYTMKVLLGHRSCEAGKHTEGFITNTNRFVGREEAGIIAFTAKQTENLHHRLLSEHLW